MGEARHKLNSIIALAGVTEPAKLFFEARHQNNGLIWRRNMHDYKAKGKLFSTKIHDANLI